MYVDHLDTCFSNAFLGLSKLSPEVLHIQGMAGHCTRHLYNNLLSMDDARYLEIGTYKGASTCAAMYENKALVVCIDDWSGILKDPNNPYDIGKNEFLKNFEKVV